VTPPFPDLSCFAANLSIPAFSITALSIECLYAGRYNIFSVMLRVIVQCVVEPASVAVFGDKKWSACLFPEPVAPSRILFTNDCLPLKPLVFSSFVTLFLQLSLIYKTFYSRNFSLSKTHLQL
jgi:hypothetical protein